MNKKYIVAFIAILLTLSMTSCGISFGRFPYRKSSSVSVIEETTDSDGEVLGIDKIAPDTLEIEDNYKVYTYTTIKDRPVIESQYYQPVEIQYGYNALESKTLKDCYDRLLSAAYSISNECNNKDRFLMPPVRLNNKEISQKDIRVVMEALMADNPHVFWIMNAFGYGYEDNSTIIQLYSCDSSDYIQASVNALSEAVSRIIAAVPGGFTEYDREKVTHNYLIDNCTYSENVKNPNESWHEFTSLGALVNGKAVCSGYSYAAQLLLKYLGISSTTVTGIGKSGLHMWNQVKIDGLWYNLDTTWSDNTEASRYDYFNVSDDILKNSHTFSPMHYELSADDICGTDSNPAQSFNIAISSCISMDANYYRKEATVIKEFSPEAEAEIVTRLVTATQTRSEYFNIYVDGLDFNNTVDRLFYTSPYKFFYYIDNANKLISVPIDSSSVAVVRKENLSVITVKLSYTTE